MEPTRFALSKRRGSIGTPIFMGVSRRSSSQYEQNHLAKRMKSFLNCGISIFSDKGFAWILYSQGSQDDDVAESIMLM